MPRPLRIKYPNATYHVMNRGASKQFIFLNDDLRNSFLSLLDKTSVLFGAEFLAYCLMGNHYHLVIRTPEANIDRIMRHINSVFTLRFNKAQNRDGSLFRGRYKATVIGDSAYLSNVIRYVHLNPVEAGLEKHLGNYPWTSHCYYMQKDPPPPWLHLAEPLNRADIYRTHMAQGTDTETREFFEAKKKVVAFGTALFLEDVCRKIDLPHMEASRPDFRRIAAKVSVANVLEASSQYFGVATEELKNPSRGERALPRKTAMYVAQREFGLTLQSISDELDCVRPSSISAANCQFEKQLGKSSALRNKVTKLVSLIRRS